MDNFLKICIFEISFSIISSKHSRLYNSTPCRSCLAHVFLKRRMNELEWKEHNFLQNKQKKKLEYLLFFFLKEKAC